VMEQADGRYVALVPGPAEAARELAERVAMALEGVAVRDRDGLHVTAGSVGIGVAQWREGDAGPDVLIERAGAALQQDMARDAAPGDDQVTGEFRSAPIADAA
jgi:PleD family two-component response regulator